MKTILKIAAITIGIAGLLILAYAESKTIKGS
jgi:hypothetical protein